MSSLSPGLGGIPLIPPPPNYLSSLPNSSILNLNLASTAIILQSALININTLIQASYFSNLPNRVLHHVIDTHIQILGFLITNNNNNNSIPAQNSNYDDNSIKTPPKFTIRVLTDVSPISSSINSPPSCLSPKSTKSTVILAQEKSLDAKSPGISADEVCSNDILINNYNNNNDNNNHNSKSYNSIPFPSYPDHAIIIQNLISIIIIQNLLSL